MCDKVAILFGGVKLMANAGSDRWDSNPRL